ncbi:MAG: hypothetical protein MI861_18505, partial [Pirellulales bacterium]|nr:hypothetical protein [Pirellulales bacterium]
MKAAEPEDLEYSENPWGRNRAARKHWMGKDFIFDGPHGSILSRDQFAVWKELAIQYRVGVTIEVVRSVIHYRQYLCQGGLNENDETSGDGTAEGGPVQSPAKATRFWYIALASGILGCLLIGSAMLGSALIVSRMRTPEVDGIALTQEERQIVNGIRVANARAEA